MRNQTAVLDQVILVNLDVNLWSGRTKIRPQDLVAVHGQLPPEDLASLGHKKTIDPVELRPFNALKKEMERSCLEVGTRFLGGYAIPQDHFDALAEKLKLIVSRAEDAKKTLLKDYDARIEGWINKHQKWGSIIRRAVVPSYVVQSRIRFDWTAVRVSPATTGDGEVVGSTEEKANGLGTQLFREVAQAARETYGKSYEGKGKVGQRAVRPIKTIRKKMESLRFLDRRIGPICKEVDAVLEKLPKTGDIEDNEFLALRGLMILLSDEAGMKRAGSKAIGDVVDDSDTDQTDSLDDVGEPEDSVEGWELETETPCEVGDAPVPVSEEDADSEEDEAPEEPVQTPVPAKPPQEKRAPSSGWFF